MPSSQVMHKFKHGELHSGSQKGPLVKNRKQAIAIMLSEKKKEDTTGSPDTPSTKKKKGQVNTGPSSKFMARFAKASK